MCSCPIPSDLFFSLLLLLLLALSSAGNGIISTSAASNYTSSRRVTALELARIQRHLQKINKPAVTSIQSPDGDIIDCVPQHKQPAFDHPLLKNHKIQTVPPQMPRLKGERGLLRNHTMPEREIWQAWNGVGACPEGTIPIRRSSLDDVLRAKSLFYYGKKQMTVDVAASGSAGHEYAIVYTGGDGQGIYGAKAAINVWDPTVQASNEFSLSQIWIIAGSFGGPDLNTIEAGWQDSSDAGSNSTLVVEHDCYENGLVAGVSPDLYGDSKTRLFTYWTSDSYQSTGCYNLLCPGFVQTNKNITLGAAISPVSSYGGAQHEITILIWRDPVRGNWWMRFGDTSIGYWPAELFTHLADHATIVEWGGEVVNTQLDGKHTRTQMGSGHFAEEGYGKASYFRKLETVDVNNTISTPQSVSTQAETNNCYDVVESASSNVQWGTYFYYGGPGNNPKCP